MSSFDEAQAPAVSGSRQRWHHTDLLNPVVAEGRSSCPPVSVYVAVHVLDDLNELFRAQVVLSPEVGPHA